MNYECIFAVGYKNIVNYLMASIDPSNKSALTDSTLQFLPHSIINPYLHPTTEKYDQVDHNINRIQTAQSNHAPKRNNRYNPIIPRIVNKHTDASAAISTSSVLLVPYSKRHVLKYHEWMKDEVATYNKNTTISVLAKY